MAKMDLHFAVHGVGQEAWFKVEVRGPNHEVLVECDLKLAFESGNQAAWELSSGKDNLRVQLKPNCGNEHLSFIGAVEVGHSDGLIRITRHGIGSMWLVINNDNSKRLHDSWTTAHEIEAYDERKFEGGVAK